MRAITNWTGREWRSNMGDTRRAFTMRAVNGRTYRGTIYGTYCRMRAAKVK